MDTILKTFLANLGAHLGGSAQDAAIECVRIATNVPSLAGCLPKDACPQATKVALDFPAPAPAPASDELADAKATIARLEAEIAALQSAPKAALAPKAPKAAKAPKAPKAAKAPGSQDQGKLKNLIIDGVDTPVRSWRAGAMHMLDLIAVAGKKGDVAGGWFRDEANKFTAPLPSGGFAFANMSGSECEKRIRKAAKVLGLSVTLRVEAADGTTQDVAL